MVERYPDNPMAEGALLNLARAYSRKGQVDRAMDYYQRYLADYPDSPGWKEVLWELGNLYEAQGQLDVARDLYLSLIHI